MPGGAGTPQSNFPLSSCAPNRKFRPQTERGSQILHTLSAVGLEPPSSLPREQNAETKSGASFVSVNSGPGVPWQVLATSKYKIKNNQITYTTVGDVRAAGGDVFPDREPDNPYHALMFGLTPFEAERVFLENGLHPRPG